MPSDYKKNIMARKINFISIVVILFSLASCGKKTEEKKEEAVVAKTNVEVVSVNNGSIDDELTLFGTTIYQKRNTVTASIPSYITKVSVQLGDKVNKGDVLYVLQSKESRALGTDISKIDSSLTNFGIIQVRASASGIISTIDRQQAGEYVLEGTQLCTIAESNDLVFQVNVPFELTNLTRVGNSCTLILPNNTSYGGKFFRALTSMNALAQTQTILAKSNQNLFLPENMLVKVNISKGGSSSKQVLPKSCVLSDEMLKEFWVMKLINDSTAVKTSVKVGNRNADKIEIVSPQFKKDDKIISVGNYGLADTASVQINQK